MSDQNGHGGEMGRFSHEPDDLRHETQGSRALTEAQRIRDDRRRGGQQIEDNIDNLAGILNEERAKAQAAKAQLAAETRELEVAEREAREKSDAAQVQEERANEAMRAAMAEAKRARVMVEEAERAAQKAHLQRIEAERARLAADSLDRRAAMHQQNLDTFKTMVGGSLSGRHDPMPTETNQPLRQSSGSDETQRRTAPTPPPKRGFFSGPQREH